MSWRVFRWAWQLRAPLFVGTTPAGALNRCRPYVPARALWGALTAELARHGQDDDNTAMERYKVVGSDLSANYRLTYLYPAEAVRGMWQAWLPAFQPGHGLTWRREDDDTATPDRPDRVFRRRILHTRTGTAIDPGSDTAADRSLRETECLQSHWRDERGRDAGPVALVGYIFVRQSDGPASSGIARLAPIRFLFAGGDTRYGLGRLALVTCDAENQLFGRDVELDGEEPAVQSAVALGHAFARDMSGSLETLSGWGFGRQTTLAASGTPLWTPGSRADKLDGTVRFQIDQHGIWRLQ